MKYISFVIPFYNSEEYVNHAIQSILPAGDDVSDILIGLSCGTKMDRI